MTYQQNEVLTAEQIKERVGNRTAKIVTDRLLELPPEHLLIVFDLLKACTYEQINDIYSVLDIILILTRADSDVGMHVPTIADLYRLLNP